ncbi:DUF2306 domain-containing protein [Ornithinicoccus halotolerans]|uniref:DUF2306 domain-containing protein n=1 Tax=Ornithinicoccus halotolerans TaxID=1748220 RepID=UPI001296BABC|nr:DUF2306 domain-containing protein [Ornithinicoccus halotolerans]
MNVESPTALLSTDTRPARLSRRDWLVPLGLLLLAAVPVVAGAVRVTQITSGAAVTPDNDRFLTMPLPVVLHVVSATLYAVLGAFQFSSAVRRRHLRWHRRAGVVLVPAGMLVALSGAWMTLGYDMPPLDAGFPLTASRMAVSVAMAAWLVLAVQALVQRNYAAHGAWMIRAYALALGAGTQVFTHLPLLAVDETTPLLRLVAMDAGWLINAVVAEVVIRRRRR